MSYGAGVSRTLQWTIGTAAVIVLALGTWAYYALDDAGWISHRQDTEMYVGGAWPDDLQRDCAALPAKDGAIIFLGCGGASGDYLATQLQTVTFWGRTKRPDRFVALAEDARMEAWKWRCRKSGTAVTCWAVN